MRLVTQKVQASGVKVNFIMTNIKCTVDKADLKVFLLIDQILKFPYCVAAAMPRKSLNPQSTV